MIKTHQLAKRFKKLQAVKNITFQAKEGQVFGLLGPNGAGKTTTLRMLSTVIAPTAGSASVDGYDIRERKDAVRSRLGILVESAGLYAHSTPREHLRYVGNLHGLDGPELEAHINALIQSLDMQDFADRRARGFSRGMIRKVVLGMALVHDPPLVFLDEPFTGLDPHAAGMLRATLANLRNQGRTVLLVTHHLRQGLELSDRWVILSRGRVLDGGLSARTDPTSFESMYFRRLGGQGAGVS